MTTVQLVSIWSDREANPTARLFPYANGLLYLPPGQSRGQGSPALLFVHRWGAYHYDPLPRTLGPAMAERGYGFLSLGMRRRGMEGQGVATPENDAADLKLAIDHLASLGFQDVILVGEEVGALSVARYTAKRPDLRVRGVALLRPARDLSDWLAAALGAERYREQLREAGRAVKFGAGASELIDITATGPDGTTMRILQPATLFLSWWSTVADTRLSRAIESVVAPLLVVSGDKQWAQTLVDKATVSRDARAVPGKDDAAIATALARWAGELARPVGPPPNTEIVTVQAADGRTLVGFLWTPDPSLATDSAIIYVHGITGTPLRNIPAIMAPAYAEYGLATLTIELRRSGLGGQMTATPEMDVEDIEAFVNLLVSRGYKRIATSGHSLGSISITLHQILRHNPAVVANVHMAPTAEAPDWMRRGLGDVKYHATVERALAEVAAGRGDTTIIGEYMDTPSPGHYNVPRRFVHRATSWLAWWGPDSLNSHAKRIGNVDVPLMLLAGTDDDFNDVARMNELEAVAVRAPVVMQRWYQDCNHAFDGFEQVVARDIAEWLADQGAINVIQRT